MILYLTGLNEAKRIVLSDNIKGSYQIYGYKDEIIATIVAQDNKWAIYPVDNYTLYKNEVVCNGDLFDNTSNYKIENSKSKDKQNMGNAIVEMISASEIPIDEYNKNNLGM